MTNDSSLKHLNGKQFTHCGLIIKDIGSINNKWIIKIRSIYTTVTILPKIQIGNIRFLNLHFIYTHIRETMYLNFLHITNITTHCILCTLVVIRNTHLESYETQYQYRIRTILARIYFAQLARNLSYLQ